MPAGRRWRKMLRWNFRAIRNAEFLRWGAGAFDNFRVVPPGTGICHQVNLEFLSQTVWTRDEDGKTYAYPDWLLALTVIRQWSMALPFWLGCWRY